VLVSQKRRKQARIKAKLKAELSVKRKYKTTYTDIKKYFKIINEAVFDNLLSPFNEILIKQIRDREVKCMGQVVAWEWKRKGTRQYWLEMLPSYITKQDFVDTLGHEMIHLYQMANIGDTGNHNETFYSFKKPMKQIGLNI